MNQERIKDIMRGRQRGPLAAGVRTLLRIGSAGYGLAVVARNGLYQRGLLRQSRVDATVISVGNLTAGGTGKTPLVVWLCRQLAARTQVAILTRGYRTEGKDSQIDPQALGDEPALLARACPEVPVVVHADRIAGAREAITECGARVLILDDGFQHRRLRRDLDIVTIDATCPFGYERLLPAGLLREPLGALRRAQAAVITRSDQVSVRAREEILKALHQLHPTLVTAQTRHHPTTVQGPALATTAAEDLRGRRVFAFCGLGNPDGFYQTLRVLGANLVGTLTFNDHHHCSERQLRGLEEQAQRTRADLLLTTEKNWIGLPVAQATGTVPLGYLGIELAFTDGEEALQTLIDETLTRRADTGGSR